MTISPNLFYRRHTKIVATIGPGCHNEETLRRMILAGMNVARVNASHGDHATHRQTIAWIRKLAEELHQPVGILLDLQGPKIRIGKYEGPIKHVVENEIFNIAVGRKPKEGELPADFEALDKDVAVGDPLLINDGSLSAVVVHVEAGLVQCRALNEGDIAPRKGINLPKSAVSIPAITAKDQQDILFAVEEGVDMIALSFVRKADDVLELRALLERAGSQIPIIAKIEKPQALDNLEEIIQVSWGIMVARGDLGVELSLADVPVAQKRIIRECNRLCRPVITATQMLDSMTWHPQPTRAEASDVANAVLDGTDAVMLSQETAAGRYPIEVIETMVKIIEVTEKNRILQPHQKRRSQSQPDIPEAVAYAGCETALALKAKVLLVLTETGRMALLASQKRPPLSVVAFARNKKVRNLLTLVWGVHPYLLSSPGSIEARVQVMDNILLQQKIIDKGDCLVMLVGAPNAPTGSTNLMMVHKVGALDKI